MKKSFRQYNHIIDKRFNNGYDRLFYSYLNDIKKLNETYNYHSNNLANIYDNFRKIAPIKYNSQYHFYNRLFEFLKTVNPESFIKRIKTISKDIIAIYEDIHVYVIIYGDEIKASDEIEKQLDIISHAYCYYEDGRSIEIDNEGKPYLQISYAIIHTDDMTEIVYNQYNGILWHVCPKSIYENKIKNNGLLLKCGNKHKRQYLPRLYFFIEPSIISDNNIKKYTEDLSNAINNDITDDTYVLLKIDLKQDPLHHYDFYDDIEYGPNISVYTYDTIHPRCIKFIKEFNV